MKQIFHPYRLWECFQNGMWRKVSKEEESLLLPIAIEFTGNHEIYGQAMREVSQAWKYSCENFLSNKSINRKAYIGHAAVCFKIGVPERITRMAWGLLSNSQRYLANNEALKTIKLWEQNRRLILMSEQEKREVTIAEYQTTLQLS